jgi:hypothetical protein
MYSESWLEVRVIDLDIPGSATVSGSGLFTAFCDGLNMKMRGERAPTFHSNRFDNNVGVEKKNLLGLQAGAPVS